MGKEDPRMNQYTDYTDRIGAARGKEIPALTCKQIYKLFDEINNPKEIERIIKLIEEYENVPSNIYGLVKRIWNERRYSNEKSANLSDEWRNAPDCTSPEEWRAFWPVIAEIYTWHMLGLQKYNHDGVTIGLDVMEWHRLGRPKSWSPMIDHFLDLYYKVHSLPEPHVEDTCKKYLSQLITERQRRNPGSIGVIDLKKILDDDKRQNLKSEN